VRAERQRGRLSPELEVFTHIDTSDRDGQIVALRHTVEVDRNVWLRFNLKRTTTKPLALRPKCQNKRLRPSLQWRPPRPLCPGQTQRRSSDRRLLAQSASSWLLPCTVFKAFAPNVRFVMQLPIQKVTACKLGSAENRGIPLFASLRLQDRVRSAKQRWMPETPFMALPGVSTVSGFQTFAESLRSGSPYLVPGSAAQNLALISAHGVRAIKASPVQLSALAQQLEQPGPSAERGHAGRVFSR